MVNAGWALPSYLPASKQIHTFSPIMLERTLTLAVLGICPHIVGPGLEQQGGLLHRPHRNVHFFVATRQCDSHLPPRLLVVLWLFNDRCRSTLHRSARLLDACSLVH